MKKEEKAQLVPPKPKAKKQEIPKKSVPSQKKAKEQQILTERPPTIAEPKQPPKSPLLTMSLGYGPSLGSGIGGFIQLNTRAGFSFHIGAGYYPTSYFYSEYDWVKNRVLYSAGIKYYPLLGFGGLCLCGKEALLKYLRAVTCKKIVPGIIAVIQSFGSRINLHPLCGAPHKRL